jgi:hypothetical protein
VETEVFYRRPNQSRAYTALYPMVSYNPSTNVTFQQQQDLEKYLKTGILI